METSPLTKQFNYDKKDYAINGGAESIALAVVNVLINGEVKE